MSIPPRPHLLARSRFARMADRAMELSWSTSLNRRPPLDPEFIWSRGAHGYEPEDERAGREDEDVADFRLRLERLCAALNDEAQLNSLGHAAAFGQLKAAVRTRHRLGRMWREKPALVGTTIADPILVIGQMRSGTTRLHRLLAADPAHAATRLCNSIEPVPRQPDSRPLRCAAGLAFARKINPWIDTFHPFGATRADEELGWLSAALSPAALEAQYRIPSFVRWSEKRDPAPVYREFARILRTDAATMGNAGRPRVLKCPQYAEDVSVLLDRFPGAMVIRTRRSGTEVLASSVSTVASQMAYQSDHASLDWIEAEWQRKIALREDRMDAGLASFEGRVAEADFAALSADWESEIARIYRDLALPFTDTVLAAMAGEHRRARKDRHHGHSRSYRTLARS